MWHFALAAFAELLLAGVGGINQPDGAWDAASAEHMPYILLRLPRAKLQPQPLLGPQLQRLQQFGASWHWPAGK